jgi:hypothetical protein
MDSVLSVLAMVGGLLVLGRLVGSGDEQGKQEEPLPERLPAQGAGRLSGAAMEETAMAEVAERLRGELSDMVELIRRTGGGVVFEEFPGDLEENALQPDEADAGRAGGVREASCVTQRMLIAEANRLAETLARLRRAECRISEVTL